MNALKTIVIAAAASITMGIGASAATISTGAKSVDIDCTGLCEFWDLDLTPDGFNAAGGSWLEGISNNNSNANRLAFVNSVLGSSFTLQSESSDNITNVSAISGYSGGDNGEWTGSSQYYLAWGGFSPRYVLIKNNSTNNTFTWDATGQGSGLSGVDGFENIAPVPLPAAGLILLAGLGGLAALRRRKL